MVSIKIRHSASFSVVPWIFQRKHSQLRPSNWVTISHRNYTHFSWYRVHRTPLPCQLVSPSLFSSFLSHSLSPPTAMANRSSASPLQSFGRFILDFLWRVFVTMLILTSIIIIAVRHSISRYYSAHAIHVQIDPSQFKPPRPVRRRIYIRFTEAAPAAWSEFLQTCLLFINLWHVRGSIINRSEFTRVCFGQHYPHHLMALMFRPFSWLPLISIFSSLHTFYHTDFTCNQQIPFSFYQQMNYPPRALTVAWTLNTGFRSKFWEMIWWPLHVFSTLSTLVI